jgi:hypothetical protein
MRHRLPAAILAIDDEPIAIVQLELFGQLGSNQVQMSKEIAIRIGDIGVRRNHLAGDDEHVHRRLRVDIVKGDAKVVLISNLGRDLLFRDLQKDVVLEHDRLPS